MQTRTQQTDQRTHDIPRRRHSSSTFSEPLSADSAQRKRPSLLPAGSREVFGPQTRLINCRLPSSQGNFAVENVGTSVILSHGRMQKTARQSCCEQLHAAGIMRHRLGWNADWHTKQCQHARSERALESRSGRPFGIEAGTIIKRFLRSDTRRRQSRVQIRTAHSFLLRHALAKEDREAADKGIARSAAVDALHRERSHVLSTFVAGQQGSIRPQRDDTRANPPADQFLGALLRVVESSSPASR